MIDPLRSPTRRPPLPLATLNPDAGTHPICGDSRELAAAVRAGQRSWQRFPYYAQRFAERGERFTRSDSAWLVSLTDCGAEVVEEQVAWLGRVLASRGMPRYLLELHLEVLHTELVAAVPAKTAIYDPLLGAAASLRALRLRHVDEPVFVELGAAFTQEVGDEWDARLPGTGSLLVAAVADEGTGLPLAVPSIVRWMTDPSRFPGPWIAAVQRTIAAARQAANPAARVRRPQRSHARETGLDRS